jgi:hypothetical protein
MQFIVIKSVSESKRSKMKSKILLNIIFIFLCFVCLKTDDDVIINTNATSVTGNHVNVYKVYAEKERSIGPSKKNTQNPPIFNGEKRDHIDKMKDSSINVFNNTITNSSVTNIFGNNYNYYNRERRSREEANFATSNDEKQIDEDETIEGNEEEKGTQNQSEFDAEWNASI